MKFSRLGAITKKTRAENDNAMMEVLTQGSQVKLVSAGVYTYGAILIKARENLENFIRAKLEKYDCVEVALPLLQTRKLWDASGRYDKFKKSNTMFTTIGRHDEYCLSPTAEEVVFDYVKGLAKSYKDMPLCVYQFSMKFRDEIRVRGGILRSKEFVMKDAYSFSETPESLLAEYQNMRKCYIEIFTELGFTPIPVVADNGDMGGSFSEEFMIESELGEDKVLYDEKTKTGFNIEVIENDDLRKKYEKMYHNIDFSKLKTIKTMELGHIFNLGQYYSKLMNGVFTNKEGKQDYYYMGCYGIGVTRTLGILIEKNLDESGLKFPRVIEPFNVGIANMDNEKLRVKAQELYQMLSDMGLKVLWHDKNDSLGAKLKDLKLLGCRKNIILGNKFLETGKIELETNEGKRELSLNELKKVLNQ